MAKWQTQQLLGHTRECFQSSRGRKACGFNSRLGHCHRNTAFFMIVQRCFADRFSLPLTFIAPGRFQTEATTRHRASAQLGGRIPCFISTSVTARSAGQPCQEKSPILPSLVKASRSSFLAGEAPSSALTSLRQSRGNTAYNITCSVRRWNTNCLQLAMKRTCSPI